MKKSKMFIVPALVGIVLLLFGIKSIVHASNSQNWLPCKGTITTSILDQETKRTGTANNRHTTTTYHPRITYQYVLHGTEYSSNRITHGDKKTDRKSAQRVVDYYHAGKEVTVYYNPDNPVEATLTPGSWSFGPLFPGLLFFGISFFVYKSDRKTSMPALLK